MATDDPSRADLDAWAEAKMEALNAASERVHEQRRTITQPEAEAIIWEEAEARDVPMDEYQAQETARLLLTRGWWPLLHPIKAKRRGFRFPWQVP